MKTVLKLLMATIMLTSLNACVVAPYPGYVEPGATIMVPAPYYGPPYYGPAYYGVGIEYRRGWRRH